MASGRSWAEAPEDGGEGDEEGEKNRPCEYSQRKGPERGQQVHSSKWVPEKACGVGDKEREARRGSPARR